MTGILSAAKFVCELSEWTVTNLKLQKILYIAQMVHMGRNDGCPLMKAQFEAWDYGPVSPVLYQKVKAFGAKPIPNVFVNIPDADTEAQELLRETCSHWLSKTPGQLVENTHRRGGAWDRNYFPGARGLIIPNKDILSEYHQRTEA